MNLEHRKKSAFYMHKGLFEFNVIICPLGCATRQLILKTDGFSASLIALEDLSIVNKQHYCGG